MYLFHLKSKHWYSVRDVVNADTRYHCHTTDGGSGISRATLGLIRLRRWAGGPVKVSHTLIKYKTIEYDA